MAVANQTPYKEYIGNGTTKIFPLEFDCDDADHLIVKVNDIEVPALNNWSLNTNTGSVVFAIAPISQSKIILQRDTPLLRSTDYQTYNNSLRPQPVNNDFDKIWLKLQELGVTNWLTDTDIKNLSAYVNSLNEETRDDFFNKLGNLEQNTNAMLQEAVANGAVSALAITTVNTVTELNTLSKWDGRTVYVKDFANFKYSSANNAWLLSVDSAQSVALINGKTVQDMSYEQIQGTDSLRDKNINGRIDIFPGSTTATTPTVDLRNKKIVIPNQTLKCTQWVYDNNVTAYSDLNSRFDIVGQGSNSTNIKFDEKTSNKARQIWPRYYDKFRIAGMHLDHSSVGPGIPSNPNEGQLWIRNSKDGRLDDLRFTGGDVLSCVIGGSKNIIATDIKVDYQYRYQDGIAKSPLILSDGSSQCMYINGYAYAETPDGFANYKGDLADNDQAYDSKWAFINLYGLKYEVETNSNACMWQEGEQSLSNAHFFGMNYIANGFGHGVSEKAIGHDVGCTFRDSQQRGVWNRNTYYGIGNQYLNILSQNTSQYYGAAIHCEGTSTFSIGSHFEGNTRDVADQIGTAALSPTKGFYSIGDSFGSTINAVSTVSSLAHIGIMGGKLRSTAELNTEARYSNLVMMNEHVINRLGRLGVLNQIGKYYFGACSFFATSDNTTVLLSQIASSSLIENSFLYGYTTGLVQANTQGSVIFKNCRFHSVTFLDRDLTDAKYINCEFVNCTNAPDTVGLNFKCDSEIRPSTIRAEVTLAAGGSYTFPSWSHEQRGVYDITVSGRTDLPAYKGYAHKASAASAATIVNTLESTAGAIVLSWAANGYIKITVTTAGTYSIKLG